MPTTSIITWSVWGILTFAGFVFVGVYGRNCPFMDEWGVLPVISGDDNAASWIIALHNEHRFPLPRLLYLGLFRVSGDLRMAMLFSVFLLASSAFGMIRIAHQLRGYGSLADLFFPLAFLHAGHWENLLMAYQICFTLTTSLSIALILAIVQSHKECRWYSLTFAALSTVLLTGCGAAGLLIAVTATFWFVLIARNLARAGSAGKAFLASLTVAAIVGIAGLIAATSPSAPDYPRRAIELVRFGLRITAMTFGPSANWLCPLETLVVVVAGFTALASAIRLRDTQSLGLATILIATTGLIVALTWGRGWGGQEVAIMSRYSALLLPGASAAYLLAISRRDWWLHRVTPAGFAIVAAIGWPANLATGLDHASQISSHVDMLAVDLQDGLPTELIGERFDWQLFRNYAELDRDLDSARRIGLTPFRDRGPIRQIARINSVPFPSGSLLIDLPRDDAVMAIRIRGEFVPRSLTMANLRVRWKPSDSAPWHEERFQVHKCLPSVVLVGVRGSPNTIEILPEAEPGEYRIRSLEIIR